MHVVFIYLFCWVVYYLLLELFNRKRGSEWNSRILALTHAVIMCRLIEYKVTPPWHINEFGIENTPELNIVMFPSLAYFIFETCWCMYMQTEGLAMLCHHFLSLLALFSSSYTNYSGYEVVFMLWAGEFTNPFLQIRWFLRTKELHKTIYAQINEVVFVILFVFMRLYVGSYIYYMMLFHSPNMWTMFRIAGTSFHIVNLVFIYQVVMFAKHKLTNDRKKINTD